MNWTLQNIKRCTVCFWIQQCVTYIFHNFAKTFRNWTWVKCSQNRDLGLEITRLRIRYLLYSSMKKRFHLTGLYWNYYRVGWGPQTATLGITGSGFTDCIWPPWCSTNSVITPSGPIVSWAMNQVLMQYLDIHFDLFQLTKSQRWRLAV